MGDGFNVNVDEVRAHAQSVGDIAATVRSVAGGAQDSVSGGAFGQIAEFFASAITGAADTVRQSMNHAGETVDQMKSGLNQAADGYQAIEDQQVQVFTAGLFSSRSPSRLSAAQSQELDKQAQKLKETTEALSNTQKTKDDVLRPAVRKARE